MGFHRRTEATEGGGRKREASHSASVKVTSPCVREPADCKSAIQQIKNLRYVRGAPNPTPRGVVLFPHDLPRRRLCGCGVSKSKSKRRITEVRWEPSAGDLSIEIGLVREGAGRQCKGDYGSV